MNLVTEKAEFERCWPWLWASLCEFGGPTHTKEQVWERIVTGKAFMWPGERCVVVGEFVDHPIGYYSFNYWLQGGDDLDELVAMYPGINEWAEKAGCSRLMGLGREGWSRVMGEGWKKGYTARYKWLGEPPLAVRNALRYNG